MNGPIISVDVSKDKLDYQAFNLQVYVQSNTQKKCLMR